MSAAAPKPEFADEVLALRLTRENAHTNGELQFSLVWNDIADLDLHCQTPGGEKIYFGHKESTCGGWLDVDMNAGFNISLEPVENIFWQSSPSGHYVVSVHNFNNRTDATFSDPNRRVPFRCIMRNSDGVKSFEGAVGPRETVVCFDINHKGSGAVGSFVVLPPSDQKTTFSESCQKHGVTYNTGAGYYAVARKESISESKDMLLQNIAQDTFEIGAAACRAALGWPAKGTLNKGPKDIEEGFRLFVQSTSHNRVIPPGTHVLVKVPMREALARRVATNTQFNSETHTMGRAAAASASAPVAASASVATSAPAAPAAPAPAPAAPAKGRGKRGAAAAPAAAAPAPTPAPAPATATATARGRGKRGAAFASASDSAPAPAASASASTAASATATTTTRRTKRSAAAAAAATAEDEAEAAEGEAEAPAATGRAKRARKQK